MRYYMGMDVGGTYARVKLADENGRPLGSFTGEGATLSTSPYEVVKARYHKIVGEALAKLHLSPGDCLGLCLGAAGIDTEELREATLSLILSMGFERARVLAVNDCEMLLAGFPSVNCIAVIAGTGAIAMGKRPGKEAPLRYSGWNHLLSDEGSAVYIAEQALRFIIKYLDGNGDCALLAKTVLAAAGLSNQQEISDFYLEHIQQKERIASLALYVDQAAQAGDQTAVAILKSAAAALFEGVSVLARRLGVEDGFTAVLWGSVLTNNAIVSSHLTESITGAHPSAIVRPLRGNPLDLALETAQKRFCK